MALLLGLAAAAAIAARAAAILGTPETAGAPDTVRVARRDVGRVIRATGVVKPAHRRRGARRLARVGRRHAAARPRRRRRPGRRSPGRARRARARGAARRCGRRAARSPRPTWRYARADLARKAQLHAERAPAAERSRSRRAGAPRSRRSSGRRPRRRSTSPRRSWATRASSRRSPASSHRCRRRRARPSPRASRRRRSSRSSTSTRLEVWAYVDETDIGRIARGQAATFTVDTYGDDAFTGAVDADLSPGRGPRQRRQLRRRDPLQPAGRPDAAARDDHDRAAGARRAPQARWRCRCGRCATTAARRT